MNGHVSWCETCGRRLSNEVDGDGNLIEPYMCAECSEAQDSHYRDGLAS